MEPLAKGRKIADRYTLIEVLHTGAHCQVWLAQDDALKSTVALKIASNSDRVGINLLNNEFAMCGRCVHAGVVRAFEFHRDDDFSYLSSEYLSGGSLTALLGRPQAQFLPLMLQIADALQHVHEQGVVHRDVKLENFLMDGRGHARLVDFDIASVRGESGLRSGGSKGSMSPQQKAGEPPEPGDDLFAFGIALHRLLENRLPDFQNLSFENSGVLPRLITHLLHPDAAQRPADMQAVIEQLNFALAEQGNATLPPDEFVFAQDDDTGIDVVSLDAPVPLSSEDEVVAKSTRGTSRGQISKVLPWLLLYGVIGGLALFYLLPRMIGSDPDNSTATSIDKPAVTTSSPTTSVEPVGTPDRELSEPWKLAQQAKLRKEAEAELEELLTIQFYLEDKQVSLWAPDEFEQLTSLAIAGDQEFRQENFEAALANYENGKSIASQLQERASTILKDTLAQADQAMAAANSEQAAISYELAKQIDPRSQAAQAGLVRAQNLDQVLQLVAQAEELEQQGQRSEALALYRQAQKLDNQWTAASKGVGRITRQQANSAYSRHMSAGYKAMEAGDYADAHSAFERAKKIKPSASEVSAAFEQLETAVRLKDVSELQGRAQQLERAGDLRGAQREYEAAAQREGGSQASLDAMRRVRAHADVDEGLDQLLANPSRLASDSVYRQAEDTIASAQSFLSDRSVADRVSSLRELMTLARVPVRVGFSSDEKTDVLLYRVGRIGKFANESRKLRPGEYTVVGTRAGYRDVRINFVVEPGATNVRIKVICSEKI